MRFRHIIKGFPQANRIGHGGNTARQLLILLVFAPFFLFGQSKKSLEEKRQRLLKDIKTTSSLLKKTTQKREATLDRYVVLQKQINRREELVQNLADAVAAADSSISRNETVIFSLSNDVERMKSDYGRMVRAAFRRKKTTHPLLFLLNAETLNQAFRRLFFLKKYGAGRRKQSDAIDFTQKMLARKVVSIEEGRREKHALLLEATGQKEVLATESNNKEILLKSLEGDQERLKTELRDKEKAHEKLNRAIEEIIRAEVEKRAEAAKKEADRRAGATQKKREAEQKTAEKPSKLPSSPGKTSEKPKISAPAETNETEDATTADFRKLRGKMAWPVESGFISKNYGRQPHPTLKGIQITNNGIDIRTENDAQVRAVAEGVVAGVQFVPGHDNLIIVRHGDFYTVYSNLSEAWVKSGQVVGAKQGLGRVRFNQMTETSEVHFEVWQGKERLDPTGWVKK